MIEVEDVVKIYGEEPEKVLDLLKDGMSKDEIHQKTGNVVGVNQVSFELETQEIFVIMGLSGSGKSTLLRCINRLIEPTDGRIYFKPPDEERIEITACNDDELRQIRLNYLSMVFQNFALLPYKTVAENVSLGLKFSGIEKEKRRKRAEEVLKIVGLGDWADSKPDKLSGGMRQRVGLARALATDAPVLLMDEPFSALDPLIRYEMQDELIKLQNKLKRTIIFVTHDLGEALKLGDRIAIMNDGEIVQIDSPEQIIINPLTDYVARFVDNADPTDVIKADILAKTDFEVDDNKKIYYRTGKGEGLEVFLDSNGEVKKCIYEGREVGISEYSTLTEDNIKKMDDELLKFNFDNTLREAIRVMRLNEKPIVVLDANNKFYGIIGNKEIYDGILKKIDDNH
ncbi:MAG: quaternary amine ABC transporter ATP-binding protein [Halanaerobiales bacterium]